MEDRQWLLDQASARLKPWAQAFRENRAPDEAALRASLFAQGYSVVLIARSEYEFIYQSEAARAVISDPALRAARPLRQALSNRFSLEGWHQLNQEVLWTRLETQLGPRLRDPAWNGAGEFGLNSLLGRASLALDDRFKRGFYRELERRVLQHLEPVRQRSTVLWLWQGEMTRILGDRANNLSWSMPELALYHVMRNLFLGILTGAEVGDWLKAAEDGAAFAFLWPRIAVVLCWPDICVDGEGRLHRADGPAVSWAGPGGGRYFFWRGVSVGEKLIINPESISRMDILSEQNSEVRRVMAELLGWKKFMDIADTTLIDSWQDPASGCLYELFGLRSGAGSRASRVLKMSSPELKDGNRPSYVEPVPYELSNCRSARRWQFRKPDGTWPSIEECNYDPRLSFDVET